MSATNRTPLSVAVITLGANQPELPPTLAAAIQICMGDPTLLDIKLPSRRRRKLNVDLAMGHHGQFVREIEALYVELQRYAYGQSQPSEWIQYIWTHLPGSFRSEPSTLLRLLAQWIESSRDPISYPVDEPACNFLLDMLRVEFASATPELYHIHDLMFMAHGSQWRVVELPGIPGKRLVDDIDNPNYSFYRNGVLSIIRSLHELRTGKAVPLLMRILTAFITEANLGSDGGTIWNSGLLRLNRVELVSNHDLPYLAMLR